MFLKCLITAMLAVCSATVHADFTHLADGVKIGPENSPGDRLALYDFDECVIDQVEFGTMSAGEVKTITVDIAAVCNTLRYGSTLTARPMNPASNDNDKLLILHAWASAAGEAKIMVKNISSSSLTISVATYNADQWNFTYFSTSAP